MLQAKAAATASTQQVQQLLEQQFQLAQQSAAAFDELAKEVKGSLATHNITTTPSGETHERPESGEPAHSKRLRTNDGSGATMAEPILPNTGSADDVNMEEVKEKQPETCNKIEESTARASTDPDKLASEDLSEGDQGFKDVKKGQGARPTAEQQIKEKESDNEKAANSKANRWGKIEGDLAKIKQKLESEEADAAEAAALNNSRG